MITVIIQQIKGSTLSHHGSVKKGSTYRECKYWNDLTKRSIDSGIKHMQTIKSLM